MKLFIVLYIAGKVAGTWGPLPYDMAECQVREAEFAMQVDAGVQKDPNALETFKQWGVVGPADIEMKCQEHDTRPVRDPVFQDMSPQIDDGTAEG